MHHTQKILSLCLLIATLISCSPTTEPDREKSPTAPEATATMTPIPSPTVAPTPVPDTLYINPTVSLGEISPYLLGSNYGPFAAVSVGMLEQAYASGITVLRFPGGAWGDRNDLKPYHIDSFMEFANKMGATATFSVRLRESSPEKAAELVRYVNLDKKYNIRYWSVGNEPTLYTGELQRIYDTEEFNKNWRAMALAMKEVDPSILIMGPELHGTYSTDEANNPKDSQGKDWMVEFLRANGDLVDIVTFHRYPYPVNQKSASIAELRENSREWDQLIPFLRNLIQKETGRNLPIAVTELDSHWNPATGGEATPDSHFNAIWLGSVISRIARNGVFMVNHWTLTSKGGQGAHGIIGNNELRPSYYIYQMFKQFGSEQVYSSSPDPDIVIVAAKRQDGTLTVMLVNLKDESITIPLRVETETHTRPQYYLFDTQHNAESMGKMDISGNTVTLTEQSITLLVFEQK